MATKQILQKQFESSDSGGPNVTTVTIDRKLLFKLVGLPKRESWRVQLSSINDFEEQDLNRALGYADSFRFLIVLDVEKIANMWIVRRSGTRLLKWMILQAAAHEARHAKQWMRWPWWYLQIDDYVLQPLLWFAWGSFAYRRIQWGVHHLLHYQRGQLIDPMAATFFMLVTLPFLFFVWRAVRYTSNGWNLREFDAYPYGLIMACRKSWQDVVAVSRQRKT